MHLCFQEGINEIEKMDWNNGRIEADFKKRRKKEHHHLCGSFGLCYHKRANRVNVAVVWNFYGLFYT